MKKLFAVALLATVAFLTAPATQAQQSMVYTHNEISTSYGVSLIGSSISVLANYLNMAGKIADITGFSDGDNIRVKSGGSKGVINLGYAYQINKTWQFGGAFGFNRMSLILSDNTGSLPAMQANLFTILSTAQANWFRTKNDMFGMYSKLGAGVMITNAKLMDETPDPIPVNKVFPAAHLTAVGLEVGRGFRGFLELGLGMQGIVQMGIKARF